MINLHVRSEVINISSDNPVENDSFFVDTNVWYWLGYDRASLANSPPNTQAVQAYSDYIKKARDNNAKLYWCGLQYAELSHLIEKVELEIYNSNLSNPLFPKQFRHNYPRQRIRVIDHISSAWDVVESIGEPLLLNTDDPIMESVKNNIRRVELDGHDLFLVEAMCLHNVNKIITHDSDFVTVDGLEVYTINTSALNNARNARKLTTRST